MYHDQTTIAGTPGRSPWSNGRLIGSKSPLKLREMWTIGLPLQLAQCTRELALFNLAIDSNLRVVILCASGPNATNSLLI
jgi:hypothetical protein